jgi:hypothetical protein
MSSKPSETGTSFSRLQPAKLPDPPPPLLPPMPKLEDYASSEEYEFAWRVFRDQMARLRPGMTETERDEELIGALDEFGKVIKLKREAE